MLSRLSNSNLKKLIWVFLVINIIILYCHFQIYQKDPYFNYQRPEGFQSLIGGINRIPQILVLNDEKEENKFRELQEHLQKNQVDLEKVTQISYQSGIDRPLVRCANAYLTAVRHAQAKNYDYVLIMEDDFRFKLTPDQFNYVLNQFQTQIKDWDVVFLTQDRSLVKETDYPYLDRVKWCSIGGAFLIHKNYYETMIEIAKISLRDLEKTGKPTYAIDQIWRSYQIKDNWYLFNPVFGHGGFNLCSSTLEDQVQPGPTFGSTVTLTPKPTLDPNYLAELEKISEGSYKGSLEKSVMKIPTATLHPNPKCWKYYQLHMKS